MESSTSEVKGIGGAAIALIIFGLVAVIFMTLFFVIRNYMSTAQEGMTSTMDDLLSQTYSQYDDVTQTGADVLAFLKTNRDTDMVAFIGTKNSMGAYFDPSNISANYDGFFYCGLPTDASTTDNSGKVLYTDLGGKIGQVFNVTAMTVGTTSQYDVLHNTNFSPTTTQSNTKQYIKSSARFYSRAIYNAATGEMVGVAFFQLN